MSDASSSIGSRDARISLSVPMSAMHHLFTDARISWFPLQGMTEREVTIIMIAVSYSPNTLP